MSETRVTGLARLRERLLAMAGPEAEAEMLKANERNAKEFAATVRRIVPRGDDRDGHLVASLVEYRLPGIGVGVSIGGPEFPYPLHLEAGHRNKDGSVTPAKPFWYPAKRVLAKKARGRQLRAQRFAIKKITGG